MKYVFYFALAEWWKGYYIWLFTVYYTALGYYYTPAQWNYAYAEVCVSTLAIAQEFLICLLALTLVKLLHYLLHQVGLSVWKRHRIGERIVALRLSWAGRS